jgi:DNA-directed RNA polymerase specialized sigma24 family protein
VWSAARSLTERQRTVFLLRFVEDMDLLEIAAVTGMKEGTVKAHLFRALNAVRAELSTNPRITERRGRGGDSGEEAAAPYAREKQQ